MSVAKRRGANKQYEIDMRNAKLKAFFDSKPFVFSVYVLTGVATLASGYVLFAIGALMDQGVI